MLLQIWKTVLRTFLPNQEESFFITAKFYAFSACRRPKIKLSELLWKIARTCHSQLLSRFTWLMGFIDHREKSSLAGGFLFRFAHWSEIIWYPTFQVAIRYILKSFQSLENKMARHMYGRQPNLMNLPPALLIERFSFLTKEHKDCTKGNFCCNQRNCRYLNFRL